MPHPPTGKRSCASQRVRKRRKLKREKAAEKEEIKVLTDITIECNNIINVSKQHAELHCKSKYDLIADPTEPVWHNKQCTFSSMPLIKYHQKPEAKGFYNLTNSIKPPEHLECLL